MLTIRAAPKVRRRRGVGPAEARVTVLDGSREILALLTDVLESDGVLQLRSSCAVTGYDEPVTLEQVMSTRPTVLIIDPHFAAGTAGWELLGRIEAEPALRDVPVILCTAEANDDALTGRTAPAAFHVLTKPFGLDDLERVLMAAGL